MKSNYLENSPNKRVNVLQSALPGLLIFLLVLLARQIGMLEQLELITFDYFLRLRPIEEPDKRITILEIDEQDVENLGGYPLSSSKLVGLIKNIQRYKPRVIGFNVLPDLLDIEDSTAIYNLAQEYPNLIFTEKVFPPQLQPRIDLPESQIGFSDIYLDQDNHLRRIILGTPNPTNPEEYKFSFSIRVAELFLASNGYTLENGIDDSEAMRFGEIEIPRFTPNFGGYIRADAGGVQALINFRNSQYPFQQFSVRDFRNNNFESKWITNRIVIIGVTDSRFRKKINSSATQSSEDENLEGIVIQAHSISQVISSVLDKRSLLSSASETLELFWLFFCGCLGSLFWIFIQSPKVVFLRTLAICGIVLFIAYLLILQGYWVSLLCSILIVFFNGLWTISLSNYKGFKAKANERKKLLDERQKMIKLVFSRLHNGPLQDIASLRRKLCYKRYYKNYVYLIEILDELELKIREIENLSEEIIILGTENILYLGDGSRLNLSQPIHELFYQIFNITIERNLEGYRNLKWRGRSFEPIDDKMLNPEVKRELCQFLESMLLNIGKHSVDASTVVAKGQNLGRIYKLFIQDNGKTDGSNFDLPHRGEGLNQAEMLSAQLVGAKFKRHVNHPRGFSSELSWKIKPKTNSKF